VQLERVEQLGCRDRRQSALTLPFKPGENPALQQLAGKRRGGTLTAYTSENFVHLDPGESYFVLDYSVDYATQRPLFS
jgi:hypothetical protein